MRIPNGRKFHGREEALTEIANKLEKILEDDPGKLLV